MQKQEELQEKIEQIEKELWFLVKSTLPSLKEEFMGAVSNGNKEKLEELETKINLASAKAQELQTQITTINSQISGLSSAHDEINQSIQNLTNANTEINQTIEDLSNAHVGINQSIANLSNSNTNMNQSIESLSQQVDSQATTISEMRTDVDFVEDILYDLNGEVKANNNLILGNARSIEIVQQNTTTNANNITTNTNDISALSNRVATLENKPSSSGGGRICEVIYDMNSTDANINQGYTTGVTGGKGITWTKEYSSLKVYAVLVNVGAYVEIPVYNKPKSDFSFLGTVVSGKTVYIWRAVLQDTNKKLIPNRGIEYVFNTDGTVTVSASIRTDFIITRVEGVIGD